MENFVHIALAANHRYARGLNATMVSILRVCPDKHRLCFHVFSDGLLDSDKEELVILARRFGYEGVIDFREPDMKPIIAKFSACNESYTTFLRLFFPELLDLDWVLWTDVDTLWFRDPIGLWNERDDAVSVVWCKDIRSTVLYAEKWHASKIKEFRASEYACAGVALLNLKKMRETNFVRRSIELVDKYGTPILADQGVLNHLCHGDAKLVDEHWNCLYPIKSWEEGLVIHMTGIGPKFSNDDFSGCFPLYEIWFRFYKQVVLGENIKRACPSFKAFIFNCAALLFPLRKIIKFCTDPVHPWVSDFIQRFIFFSWLRRKPLWK